VESTVLMLVGLVTAGGCLAFAAGTERRWRAGAGGARLPLGAEYVLAGEAIFATGVDASTVVFDCMVAPQWAASTHTALFQPLPVRAHHGGFEDEPPLSALVRSWAECGQRVFIELPATGGRPLKATVSCGEQRVVVDVDNSAEVRRAVAAAA
jgi:hypothetical protein